MNDFYVRFLFFYFYVNCHEHIQTNEFLDSLASDLFVPLILQSTRITSHSDTLIDNMFSNAIDRAILCGNLTTTISDHLPQFTIIPHMFGNISGNKSNILESIVRKGVSASRCFKNLWWLGHCYLKCCPL